MSIIYDIYQDEFIHLKKTIKKLQQQCLLEKRKVAELHDLCKESNMWWLMTEARKIVDKTK